MSATWGFHSRKDRPAAAPLPRRVLHWKRGSGEGFRASALALAMTAWLPAAGVHAGADEDRFLAGYARALLDHAHAAAGTDCSVAVQDGTVTVICPPGSVPDTERLGMQLAGAPGFVAVDLAVAPAPADDSRANAATASPGEWFPRSALFDPLLADPREPRFFVSARRYDTESARGWFSEVGYGENFPVYRRGSWQVGISGGLFGLFDLESESFDLINADYTVGVPLTWRRGDTSARVRLYHQSSHLGDEFLLRARPERVNLSFEALEVLLARRLGDVRVYGGGEVLVHREPSDLDRLTAHGGVEYLPQTRLPLLPGLAGRPVAGADVKAYDEHDWSADVSLKAGWQFEAGGSGRLVRLLVEAFRGHSPHGQFYADRIDYLGLSIMFGL